MFKLNSFLDRMIPFMSPEEVVDKAEEIDLLAEEEDEEEVEEKDDKKDDEEALKDSEDEEEDDNEDEKETEDEELELTTPVRRKDVLAKYPNFYKEFPGVEKSIYRERAFTEILPTIEDAKQAAEKAGMFDEFDADLAKGDIGKVLKAVKAVGDESFNKMVDNYMGELSKVDKDAYLHIAGNFIRTTVINMLEEAKNSNDEELQNAAKTLNNFVFGTNQITRPTNLSKPSAKEDTEKIALENEKQQFFQEKFETSRDEINTRVESIIKSTITSNIDPKSSMSDYVKKNAIRECQEELEKMLENDTRLNRLLDRLWEDAARNKFAKNYLDKIKSAYLTSAKVLMPTAIKKARNEALKGIGKRVKEEEEDKRGPIPSGRSTTHSNSGQSDRKKEEIPKGVSTVDYLMSD